MPNQKRLDAFAGILNDLINLGSIAASRLSSRLRQKCQPLLDGGVLQEEKSGAGRAISVVNKGALETFAKKQYPAGLFGEESFESSRRGQSIEQFRDSKKKSGLDFEFLVYRQISGILRVGDSEHEGRMGRHGLDALVLHDNRIEYPWPEFSGNVATVENPTVLLHFPWRYHNIGLAILASGRISTRMINWLASEPMSAITLTHFGDYDPVGLSEFVRLGAKLRSRVDLYIPDHIEDLFKLYGNPELLTKSANLLQKLSKNPNSVVQRILELMREFGGVEHESVFLPIRTDQ